MSLADAEKIVQAYGYILEHEAPAPGCVADIRKLPYSKDQIKQALILALRATPDPQMRSHLKVGYIQLADWQPGVGEMNLGLDLSHMDMNQDIERLAESVVEQTKGAEKWSPIVFAETQRLEAELRNLKLW